SAKLKLYKSSYYDHVYRAHPLLSPWLESEVTWKESQLAVFWNQAGAVGIGTDIDSQFDGEASVLWNPGWLVMDVTQGVQAIQNGRSNFGWKLVPVSGNNNTKTFVSSDYAEDPTLRPALEIEYLLE
ncbi:MAG TPA: DNRLRE domain-containing protein, partial [Nitrosomonas sp.]|nr:DNRLRE domain-containing protein [Nitrosomonas sp.]